MLSRMEYYTSLPHGIFLVTGPTGSGKSTTLYSALKRINQTDKKIITIEDPVEYQMDGINQIHVNPQIGLTFAAGLRHIVRQDPDVIMVGEIRDRETADIAIRSALTGHFVYSTLHTNDAPSAITRLTDMGVENYLITSSLVAVLAQRLVRVICAECKRSRAARRMTPDGETHRRLSRRRMRACFGTGYRGRVGIFELMELNEELRGVIMRNEDAGKITAIARRNGMRNLREDGWDKVRRGMTTAGRSDARDAGILDGDGLLFSRSGLRRQAPHRHAYRREPTSMVASELQRQGLIPVYVGLEQKSGGFELKLPSFSAASRKDVLFFTQELATLLNAGVPLDRALSITAELTERANFRALVLDVLRMLKGGKSLADSLAAHPDVFLRSSTSTWCARAKPPDRWPRFSSGWPSSSARATTCAATSSAR